MPRLERAAKNVEELLRESFECAASVIEYWEMKAMAILYRALCKVLEKFCDDAARYEEEAKRALEEMVDRCREVLI